MILVNQALCSKCGRCTDICHEHAIHKENGYPIIDYALCSTCTQCIAICPARALSWDGVMSQPYVPADLPGYTQLSELFQERRSIRRFTSQPVERALLAEIIQSGAYAAFHPGCMRALVVDDPALLQTIDRTELAYLRRMMALVFRWHFIRVLAGLIGFSGEFERARPKIETTLARGSSFQSMPAALILMVSDKKNRPAE